MVVGVIFRLVLLCIKKPPSNEPVWQKDLLVPTICEFQGIVIRMYYDDHNPPHLHAYYAEYAAKIELLSAEVIAGNLPRRIVVPILHWITQHRMILLENWRRCVDHEPLLKIKAPE